MRKKIFALLLVAVMACSVCACGSNDGSKPEKAELENMSEGKPEEVNFENAIEATPTEVHEDVTENQAKSMQNIYKVTGALDEITGDYCRIDNLYIYLPVDELATLNKGDIITFGGQITNVEEESYTMGSGHYTEKHIKFENATRIVDNRKAVEE